MNVVKISKNLTIGCLILAAATVVACSSSKLPHSEGVRSSTLSRSSAMPIRSSNIRTAPADPESSSNVRAAQTQTSLEALRRGQPAVPSVSDALPDIYFGFNRFDLSEDARATLRAAADWLRDNPAVRVEIEGHCDELGTNEYNLALGAERAYAAKDYLISLGIPRSRLSTISYGEEIPVCHERNEQCRQRNRRARFVILIARPAV
jgi:peptidoglycan-associated lipoprotein